MTSKGLTEVKKIYETAKSFSSNINKESTERRGNLDRVNKLLIQIGLIEKELSNFKTQVLKESQSPEELLAAAAPYIKETEKLNFNSRQTLLERLKSIVEISKMSTNTAEFFSLASKLVPSQFDGNSENLQSFLDALTLLKNNCENQLANAVAFVKTRLTGKARSLITNENTIDDIIIKLQNSIKGETSQLLTAKILHLKQNDKEAAKYASEVDALAQKLQSAYITEGVPAEVAQRYTVENTVRAFSQNVTSERVRLIMEAGTFSSVQETITKFVNVSSLAPSSANIFQFRQNNFHNARRHFRGTGPRNNNYNQHFDRSFNRYSNSYNRNSNNFGNNINNYREQFRGSNRSRGAFNRGFNRGNTSARYYRGSSPNFVGFSESGNGLEHQSSQEAARLGDM